MSRLDKFKKFSQASTAKNVFAWFIDAFLLIVISALSFGFIVFPILQNNPYFKNAENKILETYDELYEIQVETNLVSFKDDAKEELLSPTEMFERYAKQQIALSYQKDNTKYVENNITLDSTFVASSYENDHLAYYFVIYKSENNIEIEDFESKDPKQYFIDLLSNTPIKEHYVFSGLELPYFNAETGISLYQFMFNNGSNNKTYNKIYESYFNLYKEGLNELMSYDRFSNLYKVYQDNFNTYFRIECVAVLITFIISYLLVLVLPQLIFANGVTLGRFFTKTRVVYHTPNYLFVILRMFLETFLFVPTLHISLFFTIGTYCLDVPILAFISPSNIVFLTIIYLIINIVLMTISKKKLSVSDIASKSYVADILLLNELEEEKPTIQDTNQIK